VDSFTRAPGLPSGQLERCIIEVADNGSGMEEKVRNNIFDPFFTTKTASAGTGLGLYVCRNLIEKLGGSIEVDSRPGKEKISWSSFTLKQVTRRCD
jgi:signal transduction histidine kinase